MASTRRLAAILAADVAGYSRLMGADDRGMHECLKAHFRQLTDPKIEEHRGRVVKNTGDGVLVEFPSVVDAVRCAAEVQRGMIDHEPMVSDERRIRFRTGVNLGDVIAEDGDIFGDGVNAAARLEALAERGGICVSGTVRDQVRDKLPYALDDIGGQSVKNIAARPGLCIAPRSRRRFAVAECPTRAAAPQAHYPRRNDGGRCSGGRHRCHRIVALAADEISSDRDGGGRASRRVHRAAARRAASVDRGAALYQSQQRSRPAIFRRWDHRGSYDRSVAHRGQFRDLAQYRLHL
jgi:class 3 adenylate cyclase